MKTHDSLNEVIISDGSQIPARQVLSAAIETNRLSGHENLGFLSEMHGFMPSTPPLLALPPAYALWDNVAKELPNLCRSGGLRRQLTAMPILNPDPETLPDQALLRASVLIGTFAHAYYHSDPVPPTALPASICLPWEHISQRLDRAKPHLSYIDMCTYNWQLIDTQCTDPLRVENLRPLVPVWGNEEERIFLGNVNEILAQSTPLVGAIVRAQEAICNDDSQQLQHELQLVIDCLHHLTYVSMPKLSLNRYSSFFVDPVVWAKTFAPLAVPIQKGVAGPVGAATPSLQVLDAFFERQSYRGQVGVETILVREWYPKHWRDFYHAVGKISVPAYINRNNDPRLTTLFRDALNAYAGETGFLGRHRLKVYGYIETAFKIGRSSTASFVGSYKDRIWDNIDKQLELARRERYVQFSAEEDCCQARVSRVISVSECGDVVQVTLKIEEGKVRYQPGDRCAILPENSDALVEKTLLALGAVGEELIELNEMWCAALNYRPVYQAVKILSLRTLLKFGQIRPVSRSVAQLLFKLTSLATLGQLLQTHTEQQWELWVLLEKLADQGFDPKQLWRTPELICEVIAPETFRMYSISSVMTNSSASDQFHGATELQLTVRRLSYQSRSPDISGLTQHGTASNFLAAKPDNALTIKIVSTPHFHLPKDVQRPVIMFAGGAGIAPFRSFILKRAMQENSGENWLFFSIRSRLDFLYQQEIEQFVAQGKLHVRLAFSREDIKATFIPDSSNGKFMFTSSTHHQVIDEELYYEENAHQLMYLIREPSEGGLGAHVYVCGQAGFARSVMDSLQTVFEHSCKKPLWESQMLARQSLYRLIAQGRYQQDIFTTYTDADAEGAVQYDLSKIVLYNNEKDGYWVIIEGAVLDVTEFMCSHPGGAKILGAYAGMDATSAYQRVGHSNNKGIQAMLDTYKIGIVRPLNLSLKPSFSPVDNSASLAQLYRYWVDYLFDIVEIENALRNDSSIQREAATHDENRNTVTVSPAKLLMAVRSHQRFLQEFIPELLGETLKQVLQSTVQVCSEDSTLLPEMLDAIQQLKPEPRVITLGENLISRLKDPIETDTVTEKVVIMGLHKQCDFLERENKRCLLELKFIVRATVQVFEKFDLNVLIYGQTQLMETVNHISHVMHQYYDRILVLAEDCPSEKRTTFSSPVVWQRNERKGKKYA